MSNMNGDTVAEVSDNSDSRRGLGARCWLMLRNDRIAFVAAIFLAIVVLCAILAPIIAPADPNKQELTAILLPPSADHLLGTDDVGRDLFSRLIYGSQVSLIAALISVGVGVIFGVAIGVIAGFAGGWVDAIIMRFVDTLLAFPALVLAIGVGAALGPGLVKAMVAVGVVFAPIFARLARGQVLALKERLFIEVASTYGTSKARIVRRHILPNIARPIVVQATFLMAVGLLAEAALSFLGLGVRPPTSSWGSMLKSAFDFVASAPYQIYAPGAAIALTVLAFNLLGDFANDVLDPTIPAERASRRGRKRAAKPRRDVSPSVAPRDRTHEAAGRSNPTKEGN
ncbi:ABC transporter permease [Cumulibacter soli]|uniref:ABC transporter permease n=1 Tax=Cumulibacter soli TaxID=2546344 RepID=UPI001ABB6640|nr:ABC transporter permease [Cumulibacter soli]